MSLEKIAAACMCRKMRYFFLLTIKVSNLLLLFFIPLKGIFATLRLMMCILEKGRMMKICFMGRFEIHPFLSVLIFFILNVTISYSIIKAVSVLTRRGDKITGVDFIRFIAALNI